MHACSKCSVCLDQLGGEDKMAGREAVRHDLESRQVYVLGEFVSVSFDKLNVHLSLRKS